MRRAGRCLAFACIAATMSLSAQSPRLPKVEILGDEYYYYEVGKGESFYGICRTLGWDPAIAAKLNPKAASGLKSGMRIYYPTDNAQSDAQSSRTEITADTAPIVHTVKRGETVYSISRLYGIPVESIYASHPSARSGIRAGETITISQAPASDGDGAYYYHKVKSGETLYGVSKKYRTTVEDILALNPGVSETNFRAGSIIKVQPNSNADKIHTETVEETELTGFTQYKVKKGETWNSIAEKTGNSVDDLREANQGVDEPKKNKTITVPETQKVERQKEYVEEDPREKTADGIRELYDEVNNVEMRPASERPSVNAVVLLADPSGTLDLEFLRGMLVGIDQLKDSGIGIDLKVVEGSGFDADGNPEEALADADIIFSTADKNFPQELASFGNESKIEVVNVFDVRSELYSDNPSVVQLLPPSSYFNDALSAYVKSNFGGRTLILVGSPEADDAVVAAMADAKIVRLPVDEIADYGFDPSGRYLIAGYGTRKQEVGDLLSGIRGAIEANPDVDIAVIGRPSWITLVSELGSQFKDLGVLVPSRFYFTDDQGAGRVFARKFEDMFDREPAKSFPSFAAAGYDSAIYFLPSAAYNGGDFNNGLRPAATIQSDLGIERVSNWSGFVNPNAYMLRFGPSGVEKIVIK